MAMLFASAAASDSASRTDPPGWAIAVMPALAATSTESGNGKEGIRSHNSALRFRARAFGRNADTIDAIGLTAADADCGFALRKTMALDLVC